MSATENFSMFFVQEMLTNCKLISERIAEHHMTRSAYTVSSEMQDLLAMPMLRICELAARFESEFVRLNKNYDWSAMAKMRNQIAHPYGGFDFDFVWDAAIEDIPELTKICENLLHSE
jgi:uncharacterized protein with HEPN domain